MGLGAIGWTDVAAAVAAGKSLVMLVPLLGRPRLEMSADALLLSPVRKQLVTIVRAEPGIALGELRERLDLGWGSTYHHLRALETAGVVETRVMGRRKLVFPAREVTALRTHAVLLRTATARAFANSIVRDPPESVSDLIARRVASPRATYYHVRRFLDHGLLRAGSPTRYHDLEPTPLLVRLVTETKR